MRFIFIVNATKLANSNAYANVSGQYLLLFANVKINKFSGLEVLGHTWNISRSFWVRSHVSFNIRFHKSIPDRSFRRLDETNLGHCRRTSFQIQGVQVLRSSNLPDLVNFLKFVVDSGGVHPRPPRPLLTWGGCAPPHPT